MIKSSIITVIISIIVLASSCTTTQMSVSSGAYKSAVEKINTDITLAGYQLSGSGSESKNELVVTGQSYSAKTGYGTQMSNDFSIYDNYTYTDSLNNTIEFQLKHKAAKDMNQKEYVYGIEMVKCSCADKKYYSKVCGEDGVVKAITKLPNDQQIVVYDKMKTIYAIIGVSAGLSILTSIITYTALDY